MSRGIFISSKLIKHLKKHSIEKLEYKQEIIRKWRTSLSKENFDEINEQSLKGKFLVDIFEEVLGYKVRVGEDRWTMQVETRTEADATTPDAVLGYYTDTRSYTLAVVEVKGAATKLDDKQKRKDGRTTIEQAFNYRHKYERCEWVIVTNFREIRLYSMDSSINYELFKIEEMADDILLLERFCFLLGVDTLILPQKKMDASVVEKIYAESVEINKLIVLHELNRETSLSESAIDKHKATLLNSIYRKINNAKYVLGDFVQVDCGLPFTELEGTEYPETYDFERFWSGKLSPLQPFQDLRYIKREVLEYFPAFNEKFFRGKRILINRFKPSNPLNRRHIQASLAVESFFNSKELLNLLVTDDRISPEYLVGLLNSKLVSMWYLEQVKKGLVADYSQVVPTDIKKFPFAFPSVENKELIEKSVRERLALEKKLLKVQERFLEEMSYFPGSEMLIDNIREDGYMVSLLLDTQFKTFVQALPKKKGRIFKDLEAERRQEFTRTASQINARRIGCDGAVAKTYGLELEEFIYVHNPSAKPNLVGSKK